MLYAFQASHRRKKPTAQPYTALIQQTEGWWIGSIQELPGINCQERPREELLVSLRSALKDILGINRHEAMHRIKAGYQAISISI